MPVDGLGAAEVDPIRIGYPMNGNLGEFVWTSYVSGFYAAGFHHYVSDCGRFNPIPLCLAFTSSARITRR